MRYSINPSCIKQTMMRRCNVGEKQFKALSGKWVQNFFYPWMPRDVEDNVMALIATYEDGEYTTTTLHLYPWKTNNITIDDSTFKLKIPS